MLFCSLQAGRRKESAIPAVLQSGAARERGQSVAVSHGSLYTVATK